MSENQGLWSKFQYDMTTAGDHNNLLAPQEHEFLCALILDAIANYQKPKIDKWQIQAELWLFHDEQGTISFRDICDHLNLEIDYVRRMIKQMEVVTDSVGRRPRKLRRSPMVGNMRVVPYDGQRNHR